MTQGKQQTITALSIIDEAFHLIRKAPGAILLPYYLGTMPFVLGLLYFWNDMSRNAAAGDYCVQASFGMCLVYVWMKVWQSVYATRLNAVRSRQAAPAISLAGCFWMVIDQTVLQSWSLLVIPVAAVITIPFAWCVALYPMLQKNDPSGRSSLGERVSRELSAARHYTWECHLIIVVLFLFSVFVFFNIGITVYFLPFLAKSLFGVESMVSMGGFNLLNSTFLLLVACLTYLCVDPVFRAVFVLMSFYYGSRKTGRDLSADLSAVRVTARHVILIVSGLAVFGVAAPCRAADSASPQAAPAETRIEASRLASAIDEVMNRREYVWKMPVKKAAVERPENDFVIRALQWIASGIRETLQGCNTWMEAFFRWLARVFEAIARMRPEPEKQKETEKPEWPSVVMVLALILLVIAVVCLIGGRFRSTRPAVREPDAPEQPDLNDETLLADRLPPDQWAELGKSLIAAEDFRSAMRALFLGTLARLAEKNLIRLAVFKCNRDYTQELSRRALSKPELVIAFRAMVRVVDRVWYGMHPVDRQMVDNVAGLQEEIAYAAG